MIQKKQKTWEQIFPIVWNCLKDVKKMYFGAIKIKS